MLFYFYKMGSDLALPPALVTEVVSEEAVMTVEEEEVLQEEEEVFLELGIPTLLLRASIRDRITVVILV